MRGGRPEDGGCEAGHGQEDHGRGRLIGHKEGGRGGG